MGAYPALSVQAPQDPTQGLERAVSLRNLLTNAPYQTQILRQQAQAGALENQQRQQQLKDQQVTSKALLNWNGKDPQDLIGDVVKNGGSANAAMGLQQHFLQLRDIASQIALRDAQTGSTNLKSILDKHDQYLGAINSAENVPDDQLHDHLSQTLNSLIPDNADPQSLTFKQNALRVLQSNASPADTRKQLDVQKAMLQGSKEQFEQAQTQAKTRESTASAAAKEQESAFYKQAGVGAPGVPPEAVQQASAIQQNPGMTPAQYPGYKAAQTARAEQPYQIQRAVAQGRAVAEMQQQVAAGSNAAVKNVPAHLVTPAVEAAQKAGAAYAQEKSVSDRLQAMMDAAKQGNVVSYQLIPQEGALQVTTSQGVHRINMAEIQNYGGGSLWQRLQGHIGKQLTGQSIPASVLSDMRDMQAIQTKGSREKYENTLKTINDSYGAQFKPVELSDTVNAGHSFTLNGQRFENVPDALYKKYKGQAGFSE